MSSIVRRLRDGTDPRSDELRLEAATEIERLEQALSSAHARVKGCHQGGCADAAAARREIREALTEEEKNDLANEATDKIARLVRHLR